MQKLPIFSKKLKGDKLFTYNYKILGQICLFID